MDSGIAEPRGLDCQVLDPTRFERRIGACYRLKNHTLHVACCQVFQIHHFLTSRRMHDKETLSGTPASPSSPGGERPKPYIPASCAEGVPPFLDQIISSPHGYESVLQCRGTAPALQPVRADRSLIMVDRHHLLARNGILRHVGLFGFVSSQLSPHPESYDGRKCGGENHRPLTGCWECPTTHERVWCI